MNFAVSIFVTGVTMLFLDVVGRSFFAGSYQETIMRQFYISLVLMTGAVVTAVIVHGFARREAERRAEQLCCACHSCGINLVRGVHGCPNCGVNVTGELAGDISTEAYEKARALIRIKLNIEVDRANRLARELLEQSGFIEEDMLSEKCFKRGRGILQPIWYIKIAYAEKEAYIYTWSRHHFVPGLFGGESGKEWSGKSKLALNQLEDTLRKAGR